MTDLRTRVPSPPPIGENVAEAVDTVLRLLDPDTLLAPLTDNLAAVAGLVDELADVDLDPLATQLPAAIEHVSGLLAPATLAHLESAAAGYDAARAALAEHPLLGAIADDATVREAGLELLDGLVDELRGRVQALAAELLPADAIDQLRALIDVLERFAAETPDAEDLVDFLADHVVGVGVNVLDDAIGRAAAAAAAAVPVETASTAEAPLRSAQVGLVDALATLAAAVDELEPARPEAYAELEAHADDVEQALRAVAARLEAVYDDVTGAVDVHDPAALAALQEALAALPLDRVLTVEDVGDAAASILEQLADDAADVLRPEELRWRAEALGDALRAAFAASPLAALTDTLDAFARGIGDVVASVPVDRLRDSAGDLVARASAQIDALGLADVETDLTAAFEALETGAAERLDSAALAEATREALRALGRQIDALPVAEALAQLHDALDRAAETIAALGDDVAENLVRLDDLLAELEPFDVGVAADVVIAEIDAVRARLDEIEPPALSDAERLALATALAVLRSLDLDAAVLEPLHRQLADATRPVFALLRDIAARLERLRDRVTALAPREVLGQATTSLGELADAVDAIDAAHLLAPAQRQVDALEARLHRLEPGQLLAPLDEPYATALGRLERLDPAHWLQPAADAWTRARDLVDRLDVTSLLDSLDTRRREAFAALRSDLLAALADAAPEPLAGVIDDLAPLLEHLTGELLDEPERLRNVPAQALVAARVDRLFEPVDALFEQIVAAARSAPADALVDAANTVRERVGAGLEAASPATVMRRLRAADDRLQALSPAAVLGAALALPGIAERFAAAAADAPDELLDDVAAVAARLDEVATLLDARRSGGLRATLDARHTQAAGRLRAHVDGLDPGGAARAYAEAHRELARVVPAFLRSPDPLDYADVLEGLYGMRPSAAAQRITGATEQLLAELARLQGQLQPAVDELFDVVAELVARTSPAGLRDAVARTYAAVREALTGLDPDALTEEVRSELFLPLAEAFAAIDPAAVRQRLDQAFAAVLASVSADARAVLDAVGAAADAELAALRAGVADLLANLADVAAETGAAFEEALTRLDGLELTALVERMAASVERLDDDLERELARVRQAFSQLLAATPT